MATTKYASMKLIAVFAAITLFFCFAIGFDISPYLRGPAPYPPEWQWSYQFTNTLGRIWAPMGVGLLGLLTLVYFDKTKNQVKKFFQLQFLLCITLFTVFLQLSVLYFSRAGIGVLLERIINPGISGYFTTALSIHSVGVFLSTYQQHVAHLPMRAADHPPFAVLFFSLILFISQHLQFLFPVVEKISVHHSDIARIWHALLPYQKLAALLSTVIIPILSASVLTPLFLFTKIYTNEKTAIRACFLYSFFPAVSLFLPLNDTFLGIFGVLGFLFVLLGEKKEGISILYYFIGGISFAIGIFFSVSMVVPVGMAICFLVLPSYSLKAKVLGMLGILGGLGIIPVLLLIFFHFNSLAVFAEITRLQAKRSYLPWVFYDVYDFFIFTGIPVLLCSVLIIKTLVKRLLRRFTSRNDVEKNALAISFFSILFILNIAGFSRAETGRIWLPYMPFLAVIIASFLTKQKKFSTFSFMIIISLQLLQLLVMQEFWVTLW